MRPDLAKCTTEHPRAGGGVASCYKLKFGGKVRINHDPEHDYPNEYGGFKSSARNRHIERKEFTDVLGPLRGNLRANLGRRWDDVFSEFCQVLDRRGVSGYHIWTHLKSEVEMHTFLHHGEVCAKVAHWRGQLGPIRGFYVHPVTGILSYTPETTKAEMRRWWRGSKLRDAPELVVPGDEQWRYRQFNGLWFRYRVEAQKIAGGYVMEKIVKRQANKKEVVWIKTQLPKPKPD